MTKDERDAAVAAYEAACGLMIDSDGVIVFGLSLLHNGGSPEKADRFVRGFEAAKYRLVGFGETIGEDVRQAFRRANLFAARCGRYCEASFIEVVEAHAVHTLRELR